MAGWGRNIGDLSVVLLMVFFRFPAVNIWLIQSPVEVSQMAFLSIRKRCSLEFRGTQWPAIQVALSFRILGAQEQMLCVVEAKFQFQRSRQEVVNIRESISSLDACHHLLVGSYLQPEGKKAGWGAAVFWQQKSKLLFLSVLVMLLDLAFHWE